ncbi:Abi-alpha family protein [Paracoccus sp. SY]|uniref:Abi-alpha family protein n=1 Tax=Paracoccus sp. SY TaxID=1330255 RepID=UPI000CD02919|nr:Abi-alpha family protein [Paracoccus sp. SY]
MSEGLIKVETRLPGGEIDKAVAEVLTRALGGAADEAGGILADTFGLLGDRLKAYRHKCRVRIAHKVVQQLREEGISTDELKPLPMREVTEVIAGISDVDEEELAELWAGLLTDAMNPKNERTADKNLVATLRSMTEEDALLLNAYVVSSEIKSAAEARGRRLTKTVPINRKMDDPVLQEALKILQERSEAVLRPSIDFVDQKIGPLLSEGRHVVSVENLLSLGLIEMGDQRRTNDALKKLAMHPRSDPMAIIGNIIGAITLPVEEMAQWKKRPIQYSPGRLPTFSFHLAPRGIRLVEACRIKAPAELIKQIQEDTGDISEG